MTRREIKSLVNMLKTARKEYKNVPNYEAFWEETAVNLAKAVRETSPGFDARRFCVEAGVSETAINELL